MSMADHKALATKLTTWYQAQQRPLPWRENRDPYRIWISEIMLQQTTTSAVKDYFLKFIKTFPNVKSLADASLDDIYQLWTGLGYYSRARNLHKSAQIIAQKGFPNTYSELIKLPGLGPYSSRAISSQAFDEKVGVVDGNVTRVYCRLNGFKKPWWNKEVQNQIQKWADELVKFSNPSNLNQSLMELGATICTPKSPSCLLCPLIDNCQSFKTQTQDLIPLKKPKKEKEIWIWSPEVYINKKSELLLIEDSAVSFLKNKLIFPGNAKKAKTKPKKFDYKHNITHHEIYVSIQKTKAKPHVAKNTSSYFIKPENLTKKSPFSLMTKALKFL